MSHLKGLVEAVDGRGFVKVRLPEHGVVTDWLPVLQSLAHGAWDVALPRKGSQVALLPGLDLDDAVVLGCLPSSVDQPPVTYPMIRFLHFQDGTRIQSDPGPSALTIEAPQDVKVSCTSFEITGKLALRGNLDVQGNVQASGDMLAGGSTSAHHSHPVSENVAQPVP